MDDKNGRKLFKHPLAVAVAIATLIPATSVHAQDAGGSSETEEQMLTDLEEVVVVGVRKSLEDALERKRMSSEIMDAISAEDIGQLPDENIAEAMQRITGVQITRGQNGEGERLQVRGMSTNTVTINGVSMAVGSDRIFNFQNVSSEMFSGIEVLKTPSADKVEGGIGGTINLRTRKPLSMRNDTTASVTFKERYSEATSDYEPNASVLFGKKWKSEEYGKIGVLANVSFRETTTRGDNVRVQNWATYRGADAGIDVNNDGVADENDRFLVPRGFRASTREKEGDRLGGQVAVQWKPSEAWDFTAEGSIFKRTEHRTDTFYLVNTQGSPDLTLADGAAPIVADRFVNILNADGIVEPHAILLQGNLDNARITFGSDPAYTDLDNTTETFALEGKYTADKWKIEATISRSAAESTNQTADILYRMDVNENGRFQGNDDAFSFDYDLVNGHEIPDFIVYDQDGNVFDPADPSFSAIRFNGVTVAKTRNENTKDALRLDFTRDLDNGFITSFKTGLRFAKDEIARTSRFRASADTDGAVAGDIRFDSCTTNNGFGNYLDNASGNYIDDYLAGRCTYGQVVDLFGLGDITSNPDFRTPGSIDSVTESTDTAYFMVKFYQDIGANDMALSGNLGVRYSRTDTVSEGFGEFGEDADGNTIFRPVRFTGRYHDVLPSLNLSLRLQENMFLKFGAAKTIQRPNIADLRAGTNYDASGTLDGEPYTARRGNPELQPKRANTYDLSWEWYFDRGALLSLAAFYKDWESQTEDTLIQEEFEGNIISVRVPENIDVDYGDHYGFEFGYQQAFTSLPGLLEYTGLTFNYTHVEREEDPERVDVEGEERALRIRLSPNSYNLALWYDDGALSARLAYNWREDWESGNQSIQGANGSLDMLQDEQGVLDFSANYQITDNLKVNFAANNLTNEIKDNYLKYEELERAYSWGGRYYTLSLKYEL